MQIDEFESQFSSAFKQVFKHSVIPINKVLYITDIERSKGQLQITALNALLEPAHKHSNSDSKQIYWEVLGKEDYQSVKEILEQIENIKPDLVLVERNLKGTDDTMVFGLSNYVDALTQLLSVPILLLPESPRNDKQCRTWHIHNVILETEHITGDNNLVNWALVILANTGRLVIAHIENEKVFSYYSDTISKIPEIPTEITISMLRKKLLQIPLEYIEGVKSQIAEISPEVDIMGYVHFGKPLEQFKELVLKYNADLIVLNSKVDDQLAMKGSAYVLAVEFKNIPLLLL